MAIYIVGDIQGCFSGLQRLLRKVDFSPKRDKLIAVGDLVGRGPEALQTLDYLYSLQDNFNTVLGNHDLHLLAIHAGIRQAKSSDKFDELLASPQLKNYINWLRNKPLALMADKHTLVTHAGLYPKWSTKKAVALSAEVSEQLQGKKWRDFLNVMYGNQPTVWSKTLAGPERLRFIVNALTRMRFIDLNCELNFSCKSSPYDAPSELIPWFKVENKKLKPSKKIVFGHWAALSGHTQNHQFCGLDTGYVWGQRMTLLDLSENRCYSVCYQD